MAQICQCCIKTDRSLLLVSCIVHIVAGRDTDLVPLLLDGHASCKVYVDTIQESAVQQSCIQHLSADTRHIYSA